MAHSSLWAAVSQVAVLGIQGLAALAILLTFGKGADTDAVLAAYGVYGVLVVVCQTLRLTVVARVVEHPSPWAAFDRFLGAGLALLLLAGVLLLAFGGPIARLLTGDLGPHAESIARSTLAILWIAVGGQLVAALGAALLAVRNEFRYPGLSFVVGGIVNIAMLLALSGPVGILSVATGVAAGSILSGAAMLAQLHRDGYRLDPRRVAAGALEWRTSLLILVGSMATVMTQINLVISSAFAALLGVGAVTLYTAAFFSGAIVIALTASPAALVLAAPVAKTWDRRPEGLLPHLQTIMRAGLLLIAPAVAVVALVGDDAIDLLLGASFSAHDGDRVVGAFVALSGLFVGILAMQLPLLAAYAMSRYRAVAVLAVAGTLVHAGASVVAEQLGTIAWLAAAASLSSLTAMTLFMGLLHRGGAPRAIAIVVREVAVVGLACLVTFGPLGLAAGALGSGLWDLVAAVGGVVAFALLVHVALPHHAAVAHRMVGPVLPARMRPATA
ncbi:MAG: Lipid flippase MurJ [Solirubrobacteraceae bacterium]|jgi:peptidoglycan biosynthesis protein MviN/MurJ (putative lipid II flippase)|nr:Lipid flippase MurJ [Solirubrobacteraceae bacterium]